MIDDSLVSALERLVYKRAADPVREDVKYKGKFQELIADLEATIQVAKRYKQDMDEHELTFSAIEAEGYLRFALELEYLVLEHNK